MKTVAKPFEAILLVGPTGAGKTPLGQWLEQHGVFGGTCHHFDFGANLRAVVAAGTNRAYNREEIAFLRRVLSQGALLEQESFHLATRILKGFLLRRGVQSDHWLVLNGLPRHVGQAQGLESIVHVAVVVHFECDGATIRKRLKLDSGGDRVGRLDDHADLVGRKLAIYEERSRPLIEHYLERGARVIEMKVDVTTRPEDIAVVLG